jgi:hypothetical protein
MKRVSGRAQDGKRRHVGAEQREEKYEATERAAGQEETFGAGRVASARAAKGEDADVDDSRQIKGDEDRARQLLAFLQVRWPRNSYQHDHESGRCQGEGGVISKTRGEETEHERTRGAPEPEILVQYVQESYNERKNPAIH